MAAGGRCDDYWRVFMMVGSYRYPQWAPQPHPFADALAYDCHGRQTLCQEKRANNARHPVPAAAPAVAGWPTTRNRTVCYNCDVQGRAMANVDRWFQGPVAERYFRGTEAVFRDDGTNHQAALNNNVAPWELQLGAHHVGLLCGLCENLEIQRYWERRFGGARRQTAARAANTCKCEAHLRKTLCFNDRANYLLDVEQISNHNAVDPLSWLRWLQFNPATGRPEYCLNHPLPAPARAALINRRHNSPRLENNACRCGRDIPFRPRGPAAVDFLPNGTPTPVAMCTACDGIIVDVTHPRVTGWVNEDRMPDMLPPEEQGNLSLGRVVDEIL